MKELFGSAACRLTATCLMSYLLLTAYPRPAAGQGTQPIAAQVEAARLTTPVSAPPPQPDPGCVPLDCGGYFACTCQVCCTNQPATCYMEHNSSALHSLLGAGCKAAPGNDCSTCLEPAPDQNSCIWAAGWGDDAFVDFLNADLVHIGQEHVNAPGCLASAFATHCEYWAIFQNSIGYDVAGSIVTTA